ncbi:MAG TPA: dihydrodipicolinate synthase family protein [Synergistales bacterium]|nr:dihydrodipicolinate synthase family protein [Synergistales bacterium]
MKISGIFAPIPTPFTEREDIDFDHLYENLVKWGRSSLSGIVVLGSNGEFVSLSFEEKVQMTAFCRKHFPAEKMVIAGTGCEGTRETIRLTCHLAEAGAEAALVVNPSYYKSRMTEKTLEAHYRAVADKSPVPVMIYNMPGNTGINMSAALLSRLSLHPNIAGVKDSSGNIVQISSTIRDSREGFSVFAGSGSYLLPTLVMGGSGATMAVAGIVPDHCAAISEALEKGELARARELQMELLDLNAAVTSKHGVPGLKYALDQIGFYGGPCRGPLLPVEEGPAGEIRELLVKIGCELKG